MVLPKEKLMKILGSLSKQFSSIPNKNKSNKIKKDKIKSNKANSNKFPEKK